MGISQLSPEEIKALFFPALGSERRRRQRKNRRHMRRLSRLVRPYVDAMMRMPPPPASIYDYYILERLRHVMEQSR